MQEGKASVGSLPGGSGCASTSSAQVLNNSISGKLSAATVQGTSLSSRGGALNPVEHSISLPYCETMATPAVQVIPNAPQVVSNTPQAVASTSATHVTLNSSRHRFHVELKEGETNVVSWKKLLKEAHKNAPVVSTEDAAGADPAMQARFAERAGLGDADIAGIQEPVPPPANRFSSVIEKIERLYKGVDSEDEDTYTWEDDSQYDSKDGFIDDTELDDYFSVDKAKTKLTGFFVHRGKLEKVVESPPSPPPPVELTRKRKRNVTKAPDGIVAEESAKRRVNSGMRLKDAARKIPVLTVSPGAEAGASGILRTADPKPSKRVAPLPDERRGKDTEVIGKSFEDNGTKVNLKVVKHTEQVKESSSKVPTVVLELSDDENDAAVLRPNGKQVGSSNAVVPKKQILKRTESMDVSDDDIIFPAKSAKTYFGEKIVRSGQKENRVVATTLPKIKKSQQIIKDEDSRDTQGSGKNVSANLPLSPGPKEASPKKYAGWPKGTVLERAINDLERGVAEAFPLSGDRQAAIEKAESGGKSKRLPREVKQKLAKVARLAAKKGKIPDEFIDRLMNIIGHVMRLKTLKRNLKAMVEMGLYAKQEKDVRLQDMKLEVTEIVKSRVSKFLAANAENREGCSHDTQATQSSTEQGAVSGRFKWDEATEDRICDLYEHYVEGMDEHKGPQIRKLYIELAELWPDGWMDNHGIKSAVLRVKERRKKLNKLMMGEEKRRKKATVMSDKHKVDREVLLKEKALQVALASSIVPINRPPVPPKEKLTIKSSKQRIDETKKSYDGQSKRADEARIDEEEARRLAEAAHHQEGKNLFYERLREHGNVLSNMGRLKSNWKTEDLIRVKRAEEVNNVKRKVPRKSFEGKIVDNGPKKRLRPEIENESLENLRTSKNSILNSPLLKVKKKKPKQSLDGNPFPSLRISPSPKKVQNKADRVSNGSHPVQNRHISGPMQKGGDFLREAKPSSQA